MEEKKIYLHDTMQRWEYVKLGCNNPEQLLKYYKSPETFQQEFIVHNNDHIRYYYADYVMRFSINGKPYLMRTFSRYITFDKKTNKITNTGNIKIYTNAIIAISKELQTEWFVPLCKNSMFFSKTILQKIWAKKITNPEDLMKYYFRTIARLKNTSWKYAIQFIRTSRTSYLPNKIFYLQLIDKYINHPNLFIDKFIKSSNIYYSDYLDYLTQLYVLKINSNVGIWSDKRFIEEHNKLSLQIMEAEIKTKDQTLIFDNTYNNYLPKDIKCHFVNSEIGCFKEAQIMHNCLYTNYWNLIKEKVYFAISIDDAKYGRATAGIAVSKNTNGLFAYLDQIRGIRNSACSIGLETLIKEWIKNSQQLFKELANTPNISYSIPCEFF